MVDEQLPEQQILGNGYRIVRRLGRGAASVVWLVERSGLLAVAKVLRKDVENADAFALRFHHEIELAKTLYVPGVPRLLDVAQTPSGCPFLVSEYSPGQDLHTMIYGPQPTGGLALPAWLSLGVQLLTILRRIHDHRGSALVHRDIKPENVFVTYEGEVLLLDFGLCRQTNLSNALTRTGVHIGTPHYMAPEQIKDPRMVSRRSDLYSTALVLMDATLGRSFGNGFSHDRQDETFTQMWTRLKDSQPPKLSQLAPEMPPTVDVVFQQALQFEPKSRFATPSAFSQGLLAALPGIQPSQVALGSTLKELFPAEYAQSLEEARACGSASPGQAWARPVPAKNKGPQPPAAALRMTVPSRLSTLPKLVPGAEVASTQTLLLVVAALFLALLVLAL